jgi:hypothetical protein
MQNFILFIQKYGGSMTVLKADSPLKDDQFIDRP